MSALTSLLGLGAILALQNGTPTVGDTVWVTHAVTLPAGHTLRPSDWEPPEPVELLGPPRVALRDGAAEVAYPVVVWRPGPLVLELPGPLLLGPEGSVDSLPGRRVWLQIASVLPRVAPDSQLAPQPRADFVQRGSATVIPLLLLWGAAVLLLTPLHWWWRRRGKPPVSPAAARGGRPVSAPLERWADAGESRAVVGSSASRLRHAISARVPDAHGGLDTDALLAVLSSTRPDWPLVELRDLLRALDEARFGHTTFPGAMGLSRWAAELEPRLPEGAAA
ncbi:MAG: hypothetical protein H0T44_09560 [Gemmatimonadales bacterium]|nr:hypothetical protein [Gemmatimonadales bacterium]